MLVLASASPRRAELLGQIGVRYRVCPVDIDESALHHEGPVEYVRRVAEQKGRVALERFGQSGEVILAADTTVALDNEIFGKPVDQADFTNMMQRLSGVSHEVHTAVAVMSEHNAEYVLSTSQVHFASLSDRDILDYWRSGEPRDKAGGYGIQGLGARYVQSISGSYSGIVGLPLYETAEILARFGILAARDAVE